MFRLSERDLLSAVIERTLDRATPNNNGVGGGGNRTKKVPIDPSLSLIENLSIRILTYTRPGMAGVEGEINPIFSQPCGSGRFR
jgi:hypothetical protein